VQSVKHSFAAACEKAGIKDLRIHDLRHTCASWLVSSGSRCQQRRVIVGSFNDQEAERYAHLAPENVRAAVHALDSVSQPGHAEEQVAQQGSGRRWFNGVQGKLL